MRRLVRLVAAVLVLALVPAGARAQTDLRGQLDETRSERERVEADLAEVERDEGDARARLAAIDQELTEAERELEQLAQRLDAAEVARDAAQRRSWEARSELAEIEDELEATETELAAKRERLERRIRAAFKYGGVSFAESLAVLAGAQDVGDLANTSTYLAHVMDGDRQLFDDVTEMVGDIEEQRAEANVLRRDAEREAADAADAAVEVERATAEQVLVTERVREQRLAREAALEALREDRAAIEGHLAGLDAESQRIEDQLAAIARQQAEEARRAEEARLAEEAARQAEEDAEAEAEERRAGAEQGSCEATTGDAAGSSDAAACEQASGPAPSEPPSVSGEGWLRPVGGAVTSPFGPRWGRNHNGVDLAGNVGTGVVASRAGVVVTVSNGCHPTSSWGCGGGFGNYVTVSHADGMATIYAHLSTVAVGGGQQVAAGQSLGAVGNSGNSYGPHLHLEVRQAGTPRDPCRYLTC